MQTPTSDGGMAGSGTLGGAASGVRVERVRLCTEDEVREVQCTGGDDR